jgi:hypothetical protein
MIRVTMTLTPEVLALLNDKAIQHRVRRAIRKAYAHPFALLPHHQLSAWRWPSVN